MKDIFSNAATVFVWLGPSDKDSNRIFKDFPSLSDWDLKMRSSLARSMLRVFDREYWHRMWIVQEIILARRIHLICGSRSVSWEKVSDFFRPLRGAIEVDAQSFDRQAFEQFQTLFPELVCPAGARIAKLSEESDASNEMTQTRSLGDLIKLMATGNVRTSETASMLFMDWRPMLTSLMSTIP